MFFDRFLTLSFNLATFFTLISWALCSTKSPHQVYMNSQIRPLISLRDATMFRYTIPSEIVYANWFLKSNASSPNCNVRDVVFVIRWQGYPIISLNLDETSRHREDILLDTDEQYEVSIKSSDLRATKFTIKYPLAGVWLAFAYIKPLRSHHRIKQDYGLFQECTVNLSTHLSFTSLHHDQRPKVLDDHDNKLIEHPISPRNYFKFYPTMETISAKLFTKCSPKLNQSVENGRAISNRTSSHQCPVKIFFRRQGLPSEENYDSFLNCIPRRADENPSCEIKGLNISRNSWNYILVVKETEDSFGLSSHSDGEKKPVDLRIILNITKCETRKTSSSISAPTSPIMLSTSLDDEEKILNGNSLDDPESQNDPTIFSSLVKRDSTNKLKHGSISESSFMSGSNPWFVVGDRKTHEKVLNSASLDWNTHENCPFIVDPVRFTREGFFNFEYDFFASIRGETIVMGKNNSQYFNIPTDRANHKKMEHNHPYNGERISESNTTTLISVLTFQIIPYLDSGGSITVNLTINNRKPHDYYGYYRSNISVAACIRYDTYSDDQQNCLHILKANSSDYPQSSVRIPYPRAGHWYVTFKSECYRLVGNDGSQPMTSECEYNDSSISFSVKSYACSDKGCGKHGKCHTATKDGLILSTCSCSSGWKGLDCEDDSTALEEKEILLQFLLLTLSNIVFIPVLILALYRRLFTEAFLYLIVMVSSILHHACDSDSEQSFCIMSSDLLRYIDYYSILLSFWVTLISLSNVPEKLRTFLHLVGSVCLAIAIEHDRHSVWILLVPISGGFLIVVLTWSVYCIIKKRCFPSYQLWSLSMIPGLILTVTGIVAHSLFETKDFYPIVHSFWHVVMASALLFLIPTVEKEVKVEEEDEYRLKGNCLETYYELIAEEGSHLARNPLT